MKSREPIELSAYLQDQIEVLLVIEKNIELNNVKSRYDGIINGFTVPQLYAVAVKLMGDHIAEKNPLNIIRQRHLTNCLYRALSDKLEYDPRDVNKPIPDQMNVLNWYLSADFRTQGMESINATAGLVLFTKQQTLSEELQKLPKEDVDELFNRLIEDNSSDPEVIKTQEGLERTKILELVNPDGFNEVKCAMVADAMINVMKKEQKYRNHIVNEIVQLESSPVLILVSDKKKHEEINTEFESTASPMLSRKEPSQKSSSLSAKVNATQPVRKASFIGGLFPKKVEEKKEAQSSTDTKRKGMRKGSEDSE